MHGEDFAKHFTRNQSFPGSDWVHTFGQPIKYHVTVISSEILQDLNLFNTTDLFWYPLKISENLWFSDVFRGYQKRSVAWNGLMSRYFFPLSMHFNTEHSFASYASKCDDKRIKLLMLEFLQKLKRPTKYRKRVSYVSWVPKKNMRYFFCGTFIPGFGSSTCYKRRKKDKQ